MHDTAPAGGVTKSPPLKPFPAVALTLDELGALADYAYTHKLAGGETLLWIRRDSGGIAYVSESAGRLYRLSLR